MTVSLRGFKDEKLLTRKYDGRVATRIDASEIKDADGWLALTYRLTVHQLYMIFVRREYAYILVYLNVKLSGAIPIILVLALLTSLFVLYRRKGSANASKKLKNN